MQIRNLKEIFNLVEFGETITLYFVNVESHRNDGLRCFVDISKDGDYYKFNTNIGSITIKLHSESNSYWLKEYESTFSISNVSNMLECPITSNSIISGNDLVRYINQFTFTIFTTVEEAEKSLRKRYKLKITNGIKDLKEALKSNTFFYLRHNEKTDLSKKRQLKVRRNTKKYIFKLHQLHKSIK